MSRIPGLDRKREKYGGDRLVDASKYPQRRVSGPSFGMSRTPRTYIAAMAKGNKSCSPYVRPTTGPQLGPGSYDIARSDGVLANEQTLSRWHKSSGSFAKNASRFPRKIGQMSLIEEWREARRGALVGETGGDTFGGEDAAGAVGSPVKRMAAKERAIRYDQIRREREMVAQGGSGCGGRAAKRRAPFIDGKDIERALPDTVPFQASTDFSSYSPAALAKAGRAYAPDDSPRRSGANLGRSYDFLSTSRTPRSTWAARAQGTTAAPLLKPAHDIAPGAYFDPNAEYTRGSDRSRRRKGQDLRIAATASRRSIFAGSTRKEAGLRSGSSASLASLSSTGSATTSTTTASRARPAAAGKAPAMNPPAFGSSSTDRFRPSAALIRAGSVARTMGAH